jgi:hypothetical protein
MVDIFLVEPAAVGVKSDVGSGGGEGKERSLIKDPERHVLFAIMWRLVS